MIRFGCGVRQWKLQRLVWGKFSFYLSRLQCSTVADAVLCGQLDPIVILEDEYSTRITTAIMDDDLDVTEITHDSCTKLSTVWDKTNMSEVDM